MFFRKKRQRPPQPTWLKWAVLGFILLALIQNHHQKINGEPTELDTSLHKTMVDIQNNKTVNFTELRNRIAAGYTPLLRTQDLSIGKGEAAVCGQKVAIAYKAFLGGGKELDDKADADKPLEFTIGDGKAMPAFEEGVIGMKPGGKRSLAPPSDMAYGLEAFARKDVPADASVHFEVELLSTEPELPSAKTSPYRIAVKQEGQGAIIQCGHPAKVHVTIWGIDGKMLFTTKEDGKEPISFTPGQSKVFLGLEQGVLGMHEKVGTRTLIVPPAYQKTLSGEEADVDFPFPKAQTVLVDIETLP